MKNKIFALALIAVGLVSCTNDDVVQPTKAVATTSLDIGFKTESQNSETGKSVNRGDLYAWIKDINIKTQNLQSGYLAEETFQLVSAGGESDFHLEGVEVGLNNIYVMTSTSTEPKQQPMLWSGYDANNVMDAMKAKHPYAIYTATVNNFNFVQGAPNKLENVELTTNQGRSISVFQLSETLKQLGVYAKVTPIIDGVPFYWTVDVRNDNNYGVFYWSDAYSYNGKTVGFSWQFYKESDNSLYNAQTFSSAPNLITIVASKSINKVFTIDNQNLNTNSTSQTSFTAQIWTDEDGSGTLTGN